jgi:hypothetical protein
MQACKFMCTHAQEVIVMATDWTSLRISRGTLEDLNAEKREEESHDELVSRLLNEAKEQAAD